MPLVELEHKELNVLIRAPAKVEGKYTIKIGNLVVAHPTVKRVKGSKIRVYWDKDYGRFNRLLSGALNQFFREIST